MSGGALNYVYQQLDEVAEKLIKEKSPYRKAFGKHLLKVSGALFETEWVMSGDKSDGDEIEAIENCLKGGDVLDSAIIEAREVIIELKKLLEDYERTRN